MLLTLLFYSFIAFSSILFIYYIFVFGRFSFGKSTPKTTSNIPVSVIICAKNEADNLKEFLPSIIEQDYNNFEIVLINDGSSDATLEVMEEFKIKHNHIKIVDVSNNETFWGNKKYALTLGIKTTTNDYLLFTDADCKPKSKLWISTMMNGFSDSNKFVLGYGAYQPKKYSILNALVRFETLLTAIQYFSYAKSGNPYMGVGRNLAYHKSEFFKVDGFMSHMNVRSGDDDLFINETAKGENTRIIYTKNAHTESIAPQSFNEWYRQKRRHVSTAKHYKFKDKFSLGLFYVSQLLFWATFIVLISFLFKWEIVLLIFGVKTVVQYIVYGLSAKLLNEKRLIFALPFLELGLLIFQFSIFINNSISKPNHWK